MQLRVPILPLKAGAFPICWALAGLMSSTPDVQAAETSRPAQADAAQATLSTTELPISYSGNLLRLSSILYHIYISRLLFKFHRHFCQ